jgi:hypothetical protein
MSNIVLMEQFRNKPVRIIRRAPKDAMIPVNDIADALGYDRQPIHNIVKRNSELFEPLKGIIVTMTPGGPQETLCLNRDGVIGLLMKLDYNRIKDAERRQLIIEFQRWAIETLGRILDGDMPEPEFQPWADQASQHLYYARALAETTGVKPGIAFAAAIHQAQLETGRDLSAYMKLLPPAEHETGYLTASDIGKRLGMSAAKVNQKLAEMGFIVRQEDHKKRKMWRITPDGKAYGEEFPYVRNGHSGYQIRWSEAVLAKLQEA